MAIKAGDTARINEEDKKKVKILFTSDSLSIAGIRSLILDLIVKLDSRKFD